MGKKSKSDKASKEPTSTEPDPNLYFSNGEFKLPNGDVYVGDYCAHRCGLIWRQGHGTYTTQDGQVYEGDWVDDKLVENKELVIKYPDGSEYHGQIFKNKYNGAAVYTLDNKMDISCEFKENKPTGTVTLIDCDGKLWTGNAEETNATLLPENIFYLNITQDRGKGLPIDEQSEISENADEEQLEEEELSDDKWEQIIFAKSIKTDKDIDFTNSKWWTNFDLFKQRKQTITEKIENEEDLLEEEQEWLDKFKKYKENIKLKRIEKKKLKESKSAETLLLNQKFRSDKFINSCPAVPVIYPNQNLLQSVDLLNDDDISKLDEKAQLDFNLSETDHSVDQNQEQVRTKMRTKVLFLDVVGFENEDRPSTARGDNDSATTETQSLDNWGKYISYVEPCELHFTPEREMRLKEIKEQMESIIPEKLDKKNVRPDGDKSTDTTTKDADPKKEKGGDVKGKKEKDELGKEKKEKAILPEPIDEEKEFEDRVKVYVDDFKKSKFVEKPESNILEESEKHVHSLAVDTDSVNDIPRELMKTLFF